MLTHPDGFVVKSNVLYPQNLTGTICLIAKDIFRGAKMLLGKEVYRVQLHI